MGDEVEGLLCKDISLNKVFQECSSKIQKEIQFKHRSQTFELFKNFKAHGTNKDRRTTASLLSGPLMAPKEYASIINHFARCIQQCLL